MENGGFIPWSEWKPILRTFNCPCCMGVMKMPDEEELEQRLLENLNLLGFDKQNETNGNKTEQGETKDSESSSKT